MQADRLMFLVRQFSMIVSRTWLSVKYRAKSVMKMNMKTQQIEDDKGKQNL